MTREEVIRLAKEATDNEPVYCRREFTFSQKQLERFAHLVATEQQKRIDELLEKLDKRNEMLTESSTRWQEREQQWAAAQAQIKVLREALENCRLLAARHRKEEWATHILRFCESGGSVANPLRQGDSALRELLKAERERLKQHLTFAFLLAVGSLDQTDDVSEDIIQFCVELVERQPDEKITAEEKLREIMEAIRAMEDQ